MKQCSRCKTAIYCSRTCQQADWKTHKKLCLKTVQAQAAANAAVEGKPISLMHFPPNVADRVGMCDPSPKGFPTSKTIIAPGLDGNLTTPFTRLYVKRWLHGRTEKDCFKLLFDTIRVRTWDDQSLAAQSLVDLVQSSKPQASKLLVIRFLRLAVRQHCLPGWWNSDKERECIEFGHSEDNWKDTERPVKVHQLVARYGTPMIMLQMRIFAEQVYGPIPGKMSAMPMLRIHMRGERGQLIGNLLKAAKAAKEEK